MYNPKWPKHKKLHSVCIRVDGIQEKAKYGDSKNIRDCLMKRVASEHKWSTDCVYV